MKLIHNNRIFLYLAILLLPITVCSQNFVDATNDNAVLPVKLTNFEAALSNNNVVLKWTTANETNSSHFNILRSTNGTTFTSVGAVQAMGNTLNTTNYTFTNNNVPNVTLYYKLEQVDADGSKYYSTTIVIKPLEGTTADFVLFPNPVVNKQLAISLKNSVSGVYSLSVKDVLGKVLHQQKVLAASNTTFTINLPNQVTNGMYMVELLDANGTQKLVKQILVL